MTDHPLNSTDIAAQLERRRNAAAAAWAGQRRGDELVLVVAGEPLPIPGRADLTYPFVAHSEYLWLTDRDQPGGVIAFDPDQGWVDFSAPVTEDDRLWSGASAAQSPGPTTDELAGWLKRAGGGRRTVVRLGAATPGDVAGSAGPDREL